jgi:hypothetical protein
MDKAKGNKASGWYKEFEVRPSSSDPSQMALYAKVEFTDEAAQELKDGAWKYFSLEWDDSWQDNSGVVHNDVIIGGAITNRPIAKKTLPINFSEAMWDEVDEDTKKEFAVWSTAFVNTLPDSSFLYVESGTKDSEGKTTPRSKRHLPYKDKSGKIDLPHLRNAIARIPQMKGISASLKGSLQAKARRLLGSKSMAETMTEEVKEAYDLLIEEGFDIAAESKEWEHSEPGTGSPPAPRRDEDGSDDPAIQTGSRRDTPPIVEELENMEGGSLLTADQIDELYKLTGIEKPAPEKDAEGVEQPVDHSELVTAVKNKFAEDMTPEEKKFSEDYPTQWAEMQRLTSESNARAGRAFSESVQTLKKQDGENLKPTEYGLSSQAQVVIADVHKKFAEGTATVEDFENAIKAITEAGIVRFGESGSTQQPEAIVVDTNSATGIRDARKLFAEKVKEIQNEGDGVDFNEALRLASAKFPELADAYQAAAPA